MGRDSGLLGGRAPALGTVPRPRTSKRRSLEAPDSRSPLDAFDFQLNPVGLWGGQRTSIWG